MINRDGKLKSIVCDSCGTETDPDDNFNDLVSAAKVDGWEFKRVGGDWEHRCEACWRKRNAEASKRQPPTYTGVESEIERSGMPNK